MRGKPVGFVLLEGVDAARGAVELRRIVIGPKGGGFGRQALRLLKQYVFDELGAHRLWLDVKDFNHRARAFYRSEGFVEEGTLRECVKSPRGYESLVVMSMLASEYSPSSSTAAAHRQAIFEQTIRTKPLYLKLLRVLDGERLRRR